MGVLYAIAVGLPLLILGAHVPRPHCEAEGFVHLCSQPNHAPLPTPSRALAGILRLLHYFGKLTRGQGRRDAFTGKLCCPARVGAGNVVRGREHMSF